MKSYKIIVSGLVQGVGYRYFCYKKALQYGIFGYAKNLFNGNVEVVVQGDENLVKAFMNELNIGPHYASVKSLYVEEFQQDMAFKEFSIY